MLPNLLAQYLPRRFTQAWCDSTPATQPLRMLQDYTDRELKEIAAQLQDWQVIPSGTVGYRKAEVTLGGVDTRELSSKTMQSEKVSGLYFIGEVLDVTGHLGGFNFQWAWSSGYAAGQSV
jgi:predicted Rossmann fold flavoprotein